MRAPGLELPAIMEAEICTALFESRETTATSMAAVHALEWLMGYAGCAGPQVQIA